MGCFAPTTVRILYRQRLGHGAPRRGRDPRRERLRKGPLSPGRVRREPRPALQGLGQEAGQGVGGHDAQGHREEARGARPARARGDQVQHGLQAAGDDEVRETGPLAWRGAGARAAARARVTRDRRPDAGAGRVPAAARRAVLRVSSALPGLRLRVRGRHAGRRQGPPREERPRLLHARRSALARARRRARCGGADFSAVLVLVRPLRAPTTAAVDPGRARRGHCPLALTARAALGWRALVPLPPVSAARSTAASAITSFVCYIARWRVSLSFFFFLFSLFFCHPGLLLAPVARQAGSNDNDNNKA